jgi:hypothetical protein
MTYGSLKSLVAGLLIGDNIVPKDENIMKSLLSYAFAMIADKAEALRLLTMNSADDILRLGPGEYLVRTPNLPENDTDELDIDNELCFVTARYIASMLSKEKTAMHQQYGDDGILKYNGKVYQILEKIKYEQENNCDNTSSNCSTLAGA